ncbi:MAG: hypothetical protein KKE17_03860 [Proteobacteria bacterium]|nr:hypothetical protein [Pseudomonadota bacterium]MBU1709120.1 hypothetical protein [Pseudomonadota bacterium]
MKYFRTLLVLALLFILAGCGPIIGQLMRMSEGIKDFTVVSGNLGTVKPGMDIVVVGPFDLKEGAYSIARGDEAVILADKLKRHHLFDTEIYFLRKYGTLTKDIMEMKSESAAKLQKRLGRDGGLPDLILFGTIVSRDTIVAPTRGLITEVKFLLDFYDPAQKSSVVVEITVRDLFRDYIDTVIEELQNRMKAK